MKRPGGFDAGDPAATPRPEPDREVRERVAPVVRIGVARAEILEAEPAAGEPEDLVQRARDELKRASRQRRSRERREQRRFTEHVRVRRRRWVVAGAAVLGLSLFVAAGVFTPIMAVRDIEVQGAQAVNAEDLHGALGRFEGVPLALVSDRDVHRALEPFSLIQRYAVERIPPHTLVVRIEEREAVIAVEREGGFDLLDPAGVLLGRVAERPAGVPSGGVEMTDTSSPSFQAAAVVVRDMPTDLREQLATVRASSAQDVSFELTNGIEVIWGEAEQVQRKAAVLRSMISAVGLPTAIDVSVPDAPVFK